MCIDTGYNIVEVNSSLHIVNVSSNANSSTNSSLFYFNANNAVSNTNANRSTQLLTLCKKASKANVYVVNSVFPCLRTKDKVWVSKYSNPAKG